jgi:hypothetical protein
MSAPAGTEVTESHEDPKLTFEQYSIAFHLVAEWRGDGRPPRPGATLVEGAMRSYEDDLLLYAHRGEPPFWTRVVPTEIESVAVHFAPHLTFESEGKRKRLVCGDEAQPGRTRSFGIAAGETVFPESDIGILTVVLTADDELDEYDLIKLVKLWEGGEGSAGADSAIAEGVDLWFSTETDESTTLHGLASAVFPDAWELLAYGSEPRRNRPTAARYGYRVGTLELELPPDEQTTELFADIARLKRRREAPDPESDAWDRVVAVGGILQGLLDFRVIEDYELADVFADVDVKVDDETMRAFHKGTLLSLAAGEEAEAPEDGSTQAGEPEDDRPAPIGIDPYLALPNIVLLHDEQRLKTARLKERELSPGQRAPIRLRAGIGKTQDGLSEMAQLLAQDLPNVFHYTSERRLQQRGRASRGLDDLETFMRLRMDDLSSVLESRIRTRDRWTAAVGVALGVVTGFVVQQAIEGRPLWLVVIAGGLFGVFLWLRDRLF